MAVEIFFERCIISLYSEFPVSKDAYSLMLLVYAVTRGFPCAYKYPLGQDMKRDAMELVHSFYRTNRSYRKKEFLEEYLDGFELLRMEIRVSFERKSTEKIHYTAQSIMNNYV